MPTYDNGSRFRKFFWEFEKKVHEFFLKKEVNKLGLNHIV